MKRGSVVLLLAVAMALLLSGCFFLDLLKNENSSSNSYGTVALDAVKDAIDRASIDSIRLVTEKCNQNDLQIGESRIGGLPDLPKDFVWPKWKGKSLSFIAQIDLPIASAYDADKHLPEKGMLAFFYDQNQETWGFDPKDKGSFSVVFFEGDNADLVRTELPDDIAEEARYTPCRIKLSGDKTMPHPWSLFIESLNLSKEAMDEYFEEYDKYNPPGVQHRLLGHPTIIQNEMQTECQLVTNGLYCGDSSGWNSPRARKLQEGAVDWRLLLQIDSDENTGMMWGDGGIIYFWIKEEDLKNKRFENTWMILQCS